MCQQKGKAMKLFASVNQRCAKLQRIGKVYPNHVVFAPSEPCSRADELFLYLTYEADVEPDLLKLL